MPLVLATAANPGEAYWTNIAGGLAYWSENGAGDLYPNTDNAQTLGLTTNRVEQFIGRSAFFPVSTGPVVTPSIAANRGGVFIIGSAASTGTLTFDASTYPGSGVAAVHMTATGAGSETYVTMGNPYSMVFVNAASTGTYSASATVTEIANQPGSSMILGGLRGTNADVVMVASGGGAQALGFIQGAGSGFTTISASAAGAQARGVAGSVAYPWFEGGIYASGDGSSSMGSLYNLGAPYAEYGRITASGRASFAQGAAGVYGYIIASNNGSHAGGRVLGGTIQSTASGSFAHGNVVGNPGLYVGYLSATGNGSFAFGSASTNMSDNASIVAAGVGSFAGGVAVGYSITATGSGSFAFGSALGDSVSAANGAIAFGAAYAPGAPVQASGQNAFQFAPGLNDVPNSLQVGGYNGSGDYGVRFIGDGSVGLRDGDFWVAGGNIYCRSGGATRNLTNIP